MSSRRSNMFSARPCLKRRHTQFWSKNWQFLSL